MPKKTSKANDTLGSVSAIQTILDRYPTLDADSSGDVSLTTSLGFMLKLLNILGLTEEDIVMWLANLLSGKGTDGILVAIEHAVKAILLANVRDLFTCSINPLIPDILMDRNAEGPIGTTGGGIELGIDAIDMFGILGNCPTDDNGSMFYFDAKTSIYSTDNSFVPGYTPNEVWKSCDFNAYLWYIIHKGSNLTTDNTCIWDNRNKYTEAFMGAENNAINAIRDEFFNTTIPQPDDGKDYIQVGNTNYKKKPIIRCEYAERNKANGMGDVLKIYINPYRYYHKRHINTKRGLSIAFNKTLFEFNYDFIYSLKLFDTKTLVASITKSVLGVGGSLSYSLSQSVIEAKVSSIVGNIMKAQSEEKEVTDCFYTFSNDEYNKMLEKAMAKHEGKYNNPDGNINEYGDDILDAISRIDNAATLTEQTKALYDVINNISAIAAENGYVEQKDSIAFGFQIIYKFIEETVTQIVMQVLSPKVAVLYKLNSAMMGDIDPEGNNWKKQEAAFDSWAKFIENFPNLVISIVSQILDIILQQLYQYLMSTLAEIIKLFVSKIALETIRDYRNLLEQLLNCFKGFSFGNQNENIYAIDNVNYADIVSSEPKGKEC